MYDCNHHMFENFEDEMFPSHPLHHSIHPTPLPPLCRVALREGWQ